MVTLVQAAMGRLKAMVRRVSSPSDRRVARQTFWMGSITAVEVVRGLAQVSITARILGPEGFGALAVIAAVSTLVHGLIALPGGDTVTTFVTRSVTEGRSEEAGAILRLTMVVSQGLSLAAYAAIVVLAFTSSSLLGISETHVNALLLYGLLGVFLATRSEALAVLRLSDRMNLGLAVTLAAALTSLGLIVLAWRTDGGLPAVVTAYVAAAAVSGTGMFAAAAASTYRAQIRGFLSSVSVTVPPDVLRFQAGMFGRSTLGTLSTTMDVIMITRLAGSADAGLYRGARQIIDNARQPFRIVQPGMKVEFSRLWYSRPEEVKRLLLRYMGMGLLLSAATFGALALAHEHVIRILLGSEFSGVSQPLMIMLLGSFIAGSAVALVSLPVAAGRIGPSLIAGSAGLISMLAVVLWLAPAYGAAGAAWAHSAHSIVSTLVLLYFVLSMLRHAGQHKTLDQHMRQ